MWLLAGGELFKWLLTCLLFGKPIQTNIAAEAYRAIVAAELCSPDAILRAGWDKLVRLLDQAHYVHYDFSTATKLPEISDELKRRYGNVAISSANRRLHLSCLQNSRTSETSAIFERENRVSGNLATSAARCAGGSYAPSNPVRFVNAHTSRSMGTSA